MKKVLNLGPCVVRRSLTFSKDFSSETTEPNSIKLSMPSPSKGGKKVHISGPDHMTKIAAMPT